MAETMQNFDAAAYTANGTERERVSLPPELFDGTVNMPVMHQAVRAFLANQRQGNAATKTRGFVVGGNQKPWKQKGTGRARQGSTRAPHWVGGGTVFGPHPRDYGQYVPRQVRALARKSAFNARAREGAVLVVDRFEFDAPRTARIAAMLDRLGLAGRKVLILTDGVKTNVHLSARNLPTVHVMPYSDVSTYHLLWSDTVIIEGPAIGHTLEPVPESEPVKARKAGKVAPAAKTAKKASPRKAPAKKTAARKKVAKKKAASGRSAAKKKTASTSRPAARKSARKATGPAAKPKKKKGK
ncbi:MAG TPA: 50S ribosomal protein L4 [Gemmatimonadales bacterium]|jgi:large subunit ribosomal protein L4|nr:50S ribosomal protein L4 [Gemmatimonadales bacterium]